MYRCRKNQATLTALEKSRFVAALLALKASGTYDQYVQQHMNFMAGAHRGPAFLPWHREFLRRLELDLVAIDASVTLPYWDWTVDNSPLSSIWGIDFMGGNGAPATGNVTTGPFAHAGGSWTLAFDGPALRRRFGVGTATLPTAADVANALAETPYDVAPYTQFAGSGFRNRLEGWIAGPQLHNRVHVWIGGSMAPASSPNDPVFFLHHCFVDKLWADWQALHPGEPYIPIAGAAAGHNFNDSMEPWAGLGTVVRPSDVQDHHALGYAYDTEGLCGLATLKAVDDLPTFKFRDDIATLKAVDDQQTFKFRDDIATLKAVDDQQTLKFRDDIATLKAVDDQPTFKFRDDIGTLKAVDDQPTFKAVDDQPTLKFRDDIATLKAVDDQPTLKFQDDIATLKVVDDPQTIKAVDDQPTLKFQDDVATLKAVDDQPTHKAVDDPQTSPAQDVLKQPGTDAGQPPDVLTRAAPFVLSTPHHSMAWTQSFPQAQQAEAAQLEALIGQYEQAISQINQRFEQGQLSQQEMQEAEALYQEYEALLSEYRRLTQ